MKSKTTMIRVYEEDWEILNRYLSILQVEQRQRLSFADVLHGLVREVCIPYLERVEKALAGTSQ